MKDVIYCHCPKCGAYQLASYLVCIYPHCHGYLIINSH